MHAWPGTCIQDAAAHHARFSHHASMLIRACGVCCTLRGLLKSLMPRQHHAWAKLLVGQPPGQLLGRATLDILWQRRRRRHTCGKLAVLMVHHTSGGTNRPHRVHHLVGGVTSRVNSSPTAHQHTHAQAHRHTETHHARMHMRRWQTTSTWGQLAHRRILGSWRKTQTQRNHCANVPRAPAVACCVRTGCSTLESEQGSASSRC